MVTFGDMWGTLESVLGMWLIGCCKQSLTDVLVGTWETVVLRIKQRVESLCSGLNKKYSPIGYIFEHLVPRWWGYLGKL